MENNKNLKDIKVYKESYFMYEKTKRETIEKLSEAMNEDGSKRYTDEDIKNKVSQIQMMQDDVKQKFLISGGDINELKTIENNDKKETLKSKRKVVLNKKSENKVENKNKLTPVKNDKEEVKIKHKENDDIKPINNLHSEVSVVPLNWDMDFSESFDVIPLPSKGECYENKTPKIAVSYLTANDENMIVSPNLYRDGLILDYLLKAKIKNNTIDPDDLLEGDRDAIILWLRATGYGTQYPVTVTDNKTGIDFDTVVDLTQIKHKPFTLKGDENGYFDYELPVTKHKVKFRFLTHGDIKQIEEIEKDEQINIKKEHLNRIVEDLNTYLENDDMLTKDEKFKLYEAKRNISKWSEKLNADNDMGYTHTLTNRLELSIVSINGNENRDFISNYVENMNVRDALSIRRYITENEPGLDYTVTVERPESLGGGSMPIFLSLDEYIFLNLA